ncbi:YqzM family protein [Fictibacillus sp. Mic-4]|nr:YqzM family protein [Fictibacillus gelatini]
MNEFEKDVQCKRNDLIDAGNGFTFSFLFFTIIFAIGVLMKALS